MKIAFIVPRFEPQLAGGAEVHCKQLAERLVGHYQVEILSTCARDHFSWKNYYEPGNQLVNGVTVRRFLVDANRVTPRFLRIQRKIDHRFPLSAKEEHRWFEDGIRSQALERYIIKQKNRYDWFIPMPYLFGTAYWGIQACPEKCLLIPCLHDEPFAYLKIFKEMFNQVQGVMFSTYPEIEFARNLYELPEEKISRVSLGFEAEEKYDPRGFRENFGIQDPFILFAGRREGGKNIDLLLKYFRIYKANNNKNKLKLVLLGSGPVNLSNEDKDNIFDLGYVSREHKAGAYAAAMAFCQPSVNESLSIVMMESWLAGRPVLVNSGCAVTADHCRRSNGGLYFGSYPEFQECIDYLLAQPEVAGAMGENGRSYVEREYSWPVVVERFKNSLNKFSLM